MKKGKRVFGEYWDTRNRYIGQYKDTKMHYFWDTEKKELKIVKLEE